MTAMDVWAIIAFGVVVLVFACWHAARDIREMTDDR